MPLMAFEPTTNRLRARRARHFTTSLLTY